MMVRSKLGDMRGAASNRRPLLIVDGDSFAHRAYHGLPKTIRRAGDKGGGAILGLANTLLRLYADERPRAVLVGWDTLDAPTYRSRAFPAYQAGRQFDDELLDQLVLLPSFVTACGFANAKALGYEADDFLAAAVQREERRGCSLAASADRDAFQLASERTTILHPVRAGEMARIGPAQVRERYGVDPSQVPDFIALRGDPSDRLPGARGVGPKTAASLLRRAGSGEALLAVPTDRDIYVTRSYAGNALVQPGPRDAHRRLLKQAGRTRCVTSIRTSRCSPFGTTSAIAGRAMRACVSITFS